MRTIYKFIAAIAAPAAFAAIAFGPTVADACYGCVPGSDGKTGNGLMCQVSIGDKNHYWGYTARGQICNYDSNDEVRVYCPLLRDRMSSTAGLSCASATLVHHGDAYPGCGLSDEKSYECIVQSRNSTGVYGWWHGYNPPAGDGGGDIMMVHDAAQNMVYTDWRGKLNNSHSVSTNFHGGASYSLSCDLPPVGNCGGRNCVANLKWHER